MRIVWKFALAPYRQNSVASDVTREPGETLGANKQKSAQTRGYFSATKFTKSVLGGGIYRPPHYIIMSQALKSFGSSNVKNWAAQDCTVEDLIRLELSTGVVATTICPLP